MTTLLELKVTCKRHVLLARQRGRQIARLLGVGAAEVRLFAAASFEVALRALAEQARGIAFQIAHDKVVVTTAESPPKPSAGRFEMRLREGGRQLTVEDIACIVNHVDELAGFDVFEEIQVQNRELLAAYRSAAKADNTGSDVLPARLPRAA